MKTQDLIADYLARGGSVKSYPLGAKRSKKHIVRVTDPWWTRTSWTLVKVGDDRIDAAKQWLEERGVAHYVNKRATAGSWHVRLEKADDALLFKLTWG